MIVIDASAVLEMLKQTPIGLELVEALDRQRLEAPHVIDLEVWSGLRRWVLREEMTLAAAERALDSFLALPIRRYAHTPLLGEIWALRHNLTAYDAAYLALARSLRAELLTMDDGLRKLAARKD